MSPAGAVIAGQASLIRKIATPARTSRISTPAPVVLPAKTRSPTRRLGPGDAGGLGVSGGALVRVTDRSVCSVLGLCTVCLGWMAGSDTARRPGASGWTSRAAAPAWSRSSGRLDGVDDLLRGVPGVRRDRRTAGSLGRGLLALFADDVVLERLDRVGLRLVVVLDATDVVADQNDRVLLGRRGGAVHSDREVVIAPALDLVGVGDDRCRGLGGRLHERVADLDV